MSETRLPRTGDAPLVFTGARLAEAGGKWHAGKERNRYPEVAVWRTAAGRYVVARSYVTIWEGESDQHEAAVCADLAAVREYLRAWDPSTLSGIGYPEGEQYAARQARLLDDLRTIYRARISSVLWEIGAEERIE